MSQELEKQLLVELGRTSLPWQTSPSHGAEMKPVKWVAVTNFAAARIKLGLSSNACWVRATNQSVAEFKPGLPCVFLLPILEVPLGEVRQSLEAGLLATGLPKDFLAIFPFDDVVATGLESHSEGWAGLALKWAEQMPDSPRIKFATQTLVRSGSNQSLRHAAQKLVARLNNDGK